MSNHISNLHVITSVKGGVGKTLICLSVIYAYLKHIQLPVLAVDLNSTNPDLFRILALNQELLAGAPHWYHYAVDSNAGISVVCPTRPYELPAGGKGFWQDIIDVTTLEHFQQIDAIVDTNLHVANIVGGAGSLPNERIIEILNHHNRRIYVWIIWTWAAFRDSRAIRLALSNFEEHFQEGIEIIHVINPSVIVPPQVDIAYEMELIRIENELTQLAAKDRKPGQRLQDAKELVRGERNLHEKLLDFDGLVSLVDARAVDSIHYTSLIEMVAGILPRVTADGSLHKVFADLYEVFKTQYYGRPRNVFVIGTHDFDLTGYTDYEFGSELEDISRQISAIADDISRCLQECLRL